MAVLGVKPPVLLNQKRDMCRYYIQLSLRNRKATPMYLFCHRVFVQLKAKCTVEMCSGADGTDTLRLVKPTQASVRDC